MIGYLKTWIRIRQHWNWAWSKVRKVENKKSCQSMSRSTEIRSQRDSIHRSRRSLCRPGDDNHNPPLFRENVWHESVCDAILNQASNSNVESNHHISHRGEAWMSSDKQPRWAESGPCWCFDNKYLQLITTFWLIEINYFEFLNISSSSQRWARVRRQAAAGERGGRTQASQPGHDERTNCKYKHKLHLRCW